ncbi:MAG: hypothetical protein LBG78_07095 [Azoarcus sp.]|jgi:hypothetical protein|nr:hypothetical protein [Azoarcus sp.]
MKSAKGALDLLRGLAALERETSGSPRPVGAVLCDIDAQKLTVAGWVGQKLKERGGTLSGECRAFLDRFMTAPPEEKRGAVAALRKAVNDPLGLHARRPALDMSKAGASERPENERA